MSSFSDKTGENKGAGGAADGGGLAQDDGGGSLVLRVTTCRVPGCQSRVEETSQRPVRVCTKHQKSLVLYMEAGQSRFCQQCRRIHPLDRFEGNRKGCIQRLAHRVERRQQKVTTPKNFTSKRPASTDIASVHGGKRIQVVKAPSQPSLNRCQPTEREVNGSDKMTNFVMSERLSNDPKSGSGTGSENNGAGPHSTDSGGKTAKLDRRRSPSDEADEAHLTADGNNAAHPPHGPTADGHGPPMMPWMRSDKNTDASSEVKLEDLQSQVRWQWHANHQIERQLRSQQQMQINMARQLEWQGQWLYHMTQKAGACTANLPAAPSMPEMPRASPEMPDWGPPPGYYPPRAYNLSPGRSRNPEGPNMAHLFDVYGPPPVGWYTGMK